MQVASSPRVQNGILAGLCLWGEKSHQGLPGQNPGPHQGFYASNSMTALGVSWRLWSATAPGARVSYEYDAFGNSFTLSGTTPNPYMYRGEYLDSDLGLYYLRARYYNPLTGRFISRDPWRGDQFVPTTLHRYLYVGGDPLNWIDPSGWDFIEVGEIDKKVSTAENEAIEQVAERIECVLNTAADVLDVVSSSDAASIASLVIDVASCSSKGKKSVPPPDGPPNGYIEGPRRAREYGPEGEPFRDYDKPHQGADYPHVHEWPGGIREHPGRPYSPWPRN